MKNSRFVVVMTALVLGACSGLQQYPDTPQNYRAALCDLDPEYKAALDQMYPTNATKECPVPEGQERDTGTQESQIPNTATIPGKRITPEEQKQIRNRMIEERMAVIDAEYREFEAGLTKENVGAELAVALAGIGVGAAGSLASASASQMLSAVSGGLAGAQAAYSKSALYDRAASALVAQMRAGRKTIAAQIFSRWNQSIDDYPMWLARLELEAYIFAGSLPGAIVGTAADATVKEKEADDRLQALRVLNFSASKSSERIRKWLNAGGQEPAPERVAALQRWMSEDKLDPSLHNIPVEVLVSGEEALLESDRQRALGELGIP